MYIRVKRLELLKAALAADRIAPSKSPLAALECACLVTEDGAVTVASTNQELALEQRVQAEIQEEGAMLINAKWLARILKGLDGQEITLRHLKGGKIRISSGTTEYWVSAPDAREYPRMDIPFPGHTVAVKGIPATAKRTVFAVGDFSDKPYMKCVNLVFTKDSLRAFSSDGFRIAAAKGTSKGAASVNLLLPAASFTRLAQLVEDKDELQVGIAGKTVVFSKPGFRFSARLMSGVYIATEEILSAMTKQFSILTDAELLKSSISLLTAIRGTQSRFSLTFNGNTLTMNYESELGASSTPLPVTALSGRPEGTYWYHPDTLKECLRALNGTLQIEVAQRGALVMKTEELLCLQTAIREPKAIQPPQKKTKKKAA